MGQIASIHLNLTSLPTMEENGSEFKVRKHEMAQKLPFHVFVKTYSFCWVGIFCLMLYKQ